MSFESLAAQLEQQVRRARRAADELEDLVQEHTPEPVVRQRTVYHPPTPPSNPYSKYVTTLAPAPETPESLPPQASKRRWPKKDKLLLGLGLGAGAILLLFLTRKSAAAPAVAPKPTEPKPEPTPIDTVAEPIPEPVTPAPPEPEPVQDWRVSTNGLMTLNSLTGYHRSTKKERGPEILAQAGKFLKFPVKTVHFVQADGRKYALAVEEHNNHPELGTKNKGISIFVKDS